MTSLLCYPHRCQPKSDGTSHVTSALSAYPVDHNSSIPPTHTQLHNPPHGLYNNALPLQTRAAPPRLPGPGPGLKSLCHRPSRLLLSRSCRPRTNSATAFPRPRPWTSHPTLTPTPTPTPAPGRTRLRPDLGRSRGVAAKFSSLRRPRPPPPLLLHPRRVPLKSSQPTPPRRLKLPTVASDTLRRLRNRTKVVDVDEMLHPCPIRGRGAPRVRPTEPPLRPST